MEAVAPTRIDLAGGTLDIWPIYLMLEEPITVNMAVGLHVMARARPTKKGRFILRSADHGTQEHFSSIEEAVRKSKHRLAAEALRAAPCSGMEVETHSGIPAGSGLGGSSSLSVALLAAMGGHSAVESMRPALTILASNMEGRVLGIPPGTQDHLAAAYGGLNAWHYGLMGFRREGLPTDPEWLARRLVLAYTGVAHASAKNNWRVTRAFLDGDRAVRKGFAEVAAAAHDVRRALLKNDLEGLAAGMDRDSRARRRLFPGFHNKRTLALDRAARKAGALGGRPCGAGGGGSMVFVLKSVPHRELVEGALAGMGARILPVVPDLKGVRVRRLD
jgi:D-glycero-alpha-D-manno-heptose-7-phosphate kinase